VTRGRVRNVKQVGFEPGPKDSYGRRGSDKIRQTVPPAATGKARSPTDGRESGARNGVGVADEPRHLPPDKARR